MQIHWSSLFSELLRKVSETDPLVNEILVKISNKMTLVVLISNSCFNEKWYMYSKNPLFFAHMIELIYQIK